MVEMPGGKAEGYEATDQLCLDDDEDICLLDFDFLYAGHSFTYQPVQDIDISGLINFNRYGVDNDEVRSKQLVYDLIDEDQFFNATIQLDFNEKEGTWNDGNKFEPSFLVMNGIRGTNIKYF